MIICHTENDGKLHLRWREDGIRKETTIEDFEPYFFVSANSDEPAFYQINMNIEGRRVSLEMPYKYEHGDWKNLYGKPLKKVIISRSSDIYKARKHWSKTYEADVPFHYRYCVDKLSELKEYNLRKWYWDMEWLNDDPNEGDSITAIVVYDNYDDEYTVLTWNPYLNEDKFPEYNNNSKIVTFHSEFEMLRAFMKQIQHRDPDMLISWFGSKFDLPKLIHRLHYRGIDARGLSPYNEVKGVGYNEITDKVDNYSPVAQPIRGRITLNLDLAFERQWNDSQRGTLPSLALDYVSETVLGAKKLVSEKFPDKNEFFKRGWLEDTKNYLEYARVDVELLYRIDEEMGLSEGILALQRLLIAPFDACFYASNMGSIYFMRNADWKAPTGDKSKMREDYDGALIYDPMEEGTNGLHLGVAAFDYAGLYPSMMLARNISWETMSPSKTEFGVNLKTPRDFSPVTERSMVYFKTDKLGLLPRSVLELKTLRDEYKKRRNEAKNKREYTKWENSQMAVKRLMASFYGIIGYQGFGWANVTLAAAITASAREAIREAAFIVRGLDG
jgi:DNA polymerase elongation subunit (family B)